MSWKMFGDLLDIKNYMGTGFKVGGEVSDTIHSELKGMFVVGGRRFLER